MAESSPPHLTPAAAAARRSSLAADTPLTYGNSSHSPASTIEDSRMEDVPPHSPGSTIEDTENYQDRYDNSDVALLTSSRRDDGVQPDPRQSLTHVLSSQPSDIATPSRADRDMDASSRSSTRRGSHNNNNTAGTAVSGSSSSKRPGPSSVTWIHEGPRDITEDEGSVQNDSYSRNAEVSAQPTMTVNAAGATRRTTSGNGTIGSVYSGNKIRHLKKEDGVPLWRRDIQYNFLKQVFDDDNKVFTKFSDGTYGHSFTDIYIDAMARSSKTSKILKDKLLQERGPAIKMAMVCLLVNVGRMNTTLNFFPEMRAQLRTYHSIPCLQAHEDPNAYKQLQDAPRLKSILKGASEDIDQPSNLEKMKLKAKPRTNPVNLIFVLSQYAPRVSELHFKSPRDFFDLVMRSTLSSASRAKAFLWLMWWYLESDFSRHDAENNPFGSGQDGEGTGGLPIKVPELVSLREDQAAAENIDTQEEQDFGNTKQLERRRILEEDEASARAAKKPRKSINSSILPSEDDQLGGPFGSTSSPFGRDAGYDRQYGSLASGSGGRFLDVRPSGHRLSSHRHLSPGSAGASPSRNYYDDDDASSSNVVPPSGRGRWKRPKRETNEGSNRVLKQKMDQVPDSASPAPPGFGHPVIHQYQGAEPGSSVPQRRPRPATQHQMALAQSKKERAEKILNEHRQQVYDELRKKRESENSLFRAARRIADLPDDYDSADEKNSWGPGGLMPNPWTEPRDQVFGEEAEHWAGVFQKARKVMDVIFESREEELPSTEKTTTVSHPTTSYGAARPSDAVVKSEPEQRAVSAAEEADPDEDLDELDKELLGEAGDSGEEGDESEEDLVDED